MRLITLIINALTLCTSFSSITAHYSFHDESDHDKHVMHRRAAYSGPPPAGIITPGSAAVSYHGSQGATVTPNIECYNDFMVVLLEFSYPFSGYIYPYGKYEKCLLHVGEGKSVVKLKLGRDMCGKLQEYPAGSHRGYQDPVIEHRIMIQYDRELVGDGDTNLVMRCDRPEDYNKTIRFDLSLEDIGPGSIHSTHPDGKLKRNEDGFTVKRSIFGMSTTTLEDYISKPTTWMEIQKGEGPDAPPLDTTVVIGQPLTLVFGLSHEYYWFDANILACFAFDGSGEEKQIEWSKGGDHSKMIKVVDHGCSTRPKVFGHVVKKQVEIEKQLTLLQWVYFKAFRLPTSGRIAFGCDVQICFRKCPDLDACSDAYHPRTESTKRRKRSMASLKDNLEKRVSLVRTVDVILVDPDEPPLAVHHGQPMLMECVPTKLYYAGVISLGTFALAFITIIIWRFQRQLDSTVNQVQQLNYK